MRLILVTGMSGAGKSQALRYMEDMGFFCVDNLPPMLLPQFISMCQARENMERIAVGMDIRGGRFFDDIHRALLELKDINYEILFLDARNDVLIKRFKETRRMHPLGQHSTLTEAIAEEKRMMEPLLMSATYVIDTSMMLPRQLKERLQELLEDTGVNKFRISIMSFGFKYGIPAEADLVFDVRFIPNPFYIDRLKTHTGKDEDVREFVLSYEETRTFLAKCKDMLRFLIPLYIREGKSELVIAVGCTGGMHRSVVIADELQEVLESDEWRASVSHRDTDKEYRRYV
ncbi:MAG: RNase adapter RapZ [Eubacteriales bacterium]|nr:RNase adapter RapZ [Eubacteriales bacterium]